MKRIKMKEKIILATNNKGKIKEIKQILKDKDIISLEEGKIKIEVNEDKDTFEENAIKKAYEIWKITKTTCIADDSGLCIEILDGFPGVKTDRFLGKDATQREKNQYILEKLQGIEKEKRKAKVITSIAIIDSKGKYRVFTGILEGYISEERRGDNGFGFDEIFELENGKTLAELSEDEKNMISSRKKALEMLVQELKSSKDKNGYILFT